MGLWQTYGISSSSISYVRGHEQGRTSVPHVHRVGQATIPRSQYTYGISTCEHLKAPTNAILTLSRWIGDGLPFLLE